MKSHKFSNNFFLIFTIILIALVCGCKGKHDQYVPQDTLRVPDGFPLDYLNPYTDIPDDEFRIGMGFKTGTYEVVQAAIDTASNKMSSIIPVSNGGKTVVTYEYADSYESLKKSIGLNLSMNAKIGWFSMNSSLKDVQSMEQNSLSTYLIAKISVTNMEQKLTSPRLLKEAKTLLIKDPAKFYNNYGDRFISGYVSGGEIDLVYEFISSSLTEKRNMAVDVRLKASSLVNSVEAVLNYTSSIDKSGSTKKTKVHIIRVGDKSDLPQDSIPAILNFIKSFPSKVSNRTGQEAFLYYKTSPYTAVFAGTTITDKQTTLDGLANSQRRLYQELSWRQEKVGEAIKAITFALDTNFWQVTDAQKSQLQKAQADLRNQYVELDDCFLKCKNLANCEDCKTQIFKGQYEVDFSALQAKKSMFYKQVGASDITHDENTICNLEPNSSYRLEFRGMLYAPGNIAFEPFVSPDNDSRAVITSLPTHSHSVMLQNLPAKVYPVIYLKIFKDGNTQMLPLPIEQKDMFIKTGATTVVIRGSNRYYMPASRRVWDDPTYLTPASGWGWPKVTIYKQEIGE